MGLRNRQRAGAITDTWARAAALSRFTTVDRPATWADPEIAGKRAKRRAEREAKDAIWEMEKGWRVPVGRES